MLKVANARPRYCAVVAFYLATVLAPAGALAADDAAIEALRKEIADLRERVQKLEGEISEGVAVNPAKVVQPVEGGWRAEQNWSLLMKGMDRYQVAEILGEAEDTRRISKFDIWEYGKGQVKFYLGRLKSWQKP